MDGPVMVIWRDAHSGLSVDDLHDEYLVRTLGWIIEETHPWLTMVSEKTPDSERGATRIPLGDIIEVIELSPNPTFQVDWDGFSVPA